MKRKDPPRLLIGASVALGRPPQCRVDVPRLVLPLARCCPESSASERLGVQVGSPMEWPDRFWCQQQGCGPWKEEQGGAREDGRRWSPALGRCVTEPCAVRVPLRCELAAVSERVQGNEITSRVHLVVSVFLSPKRKNSENMCLRRKRWIETNPHAGTRWKQLRSIPRPER